MKNLALAFVFLLSAFPAFADDEYVFILKGLGNPYWRALSEGVKDTAKEKRIPYKIYSVVSDTAAEQQLNLCHTALARKPKVMVVAAINAAVGLQCMKAAAEQGVIVGDVDANISVEEAQKAKVPMAFTIGSDNYRIGQEVAKYIVSTTSKQNPKILVLEGAAGSITGEKRVAGFKDNIMKLWPKTQIMGSVSGEWERLRAMNVTNDYLQQYPDIDIIFAANDMMALGAIEAIRPSHGKPIKIYGIDGTKDAMQAIKEGRMTASVAQLPYLMGRNAVISAMAVASGKKIEMTQKTPTPVIDQEFLHNRKDPLYSYVR